MNNSTAPTKEQHPWVRGVNLGGWLILERYIAPYQFAITDCHLRGDFCWYPGQVSAPPVDSEDYRFCDYERCKPVRFSNAFGELDYPLDEYTLSAAFHDKKTAAKWLDYHFANFMSYEDLKALSDAGVTHVRCPLPHWIKGDVAEDEPWVVGERWRYFLRLLGWCRELGIEVWPDIHTAPGSQNGFDNSGLQLQTGVSCRGWSDNATHVERSLQVLRDVTADIVKEGYGDVVTGFGLLNEPFKDCDRQVYERFINDGLNIVRAALGQDTAIYVSDMFLAKTFNNGQWKWLGLQSDAYHDTYLDSHYYHVFAEEPRALSPRQHIAYVCQNEYRDTISCCYRDYPANTLPAPGVKRMVGEWSAAYDILPVAMLKSVMDGIAANATAPYFDRQLSPGRQDFLRHFVEAQMVAYEAADVGTSGAWFYWTVKMEGGAFAEWDFLRGLREGWIPEIPAPSVDSQSVYGTCYDIIFRTNDTMSIVDEYPDPSTLPANNWQGVDIDDDVVVTHGESLIHNDDGTYHHIEPIHHTYHALVNWILFVCVALLSFFLGRYVVRRSRKNGYSQIETIENHSLTV